MSAVFEVRGERGTGGSEKRAQKKLFNDRTGGGQNWPHNGGSALRLFDGQMVKGEGGMLAVDGRSEGKAENVKANAE